jgi:hypothetical protein
MSLAPRLPCRACDEREPCHSARRMSLNPSGAYDDLAVQRVGRRLCRR